MKTLALLATQPSDTAVPVTFDRITLKDAERLNGRAVTITFLPGRPAYTWGEGKDLVTVAGPRDIGGPERTVALKGDRLRDADRGAKKLTVHGRLRVINHPGSVINGKTFSGFTESRVEE